MKDLLHDHILIYLVFINALTFILFGIDKKRAKKHKWRIPEKTLLGMCLIGGFAGGFLGMQAFRHKTKHWYFYAVTALSAVLWAFALKLIFI